MRVTESPWTGAGMYTSRETRVVSHLGAEITLVLSPSIRRMVYNFGIRRGAELATMKPGLSLSTEAGMLSSWVSRIVMGHMVTMHLSLNILRAELCSGAGRGAEMEKTGDTASRLMVAVMPFSQVTRTVPGQEFTTRSSPNIRQAALFNGARRGAELKMTGDME